MFSRETNWSLADYERVASGLMAPQLYDGLFGLPNGKLPVNERNIQAFQNAYLVPRILRGIAERQLSTTILGTKISLPVILAPVGGQERYHPDAEGATARAAAAANTIFSLGIGSSFTIEETAAAGAGPKWFQLYFLDDDELNEHLVRRAEKAGFRAIVVAVDNAGGMDAKERKARFFAGGRSASVWRNLTETMAHKAPPSGDFFERKKSRIGWDDIARMRAYTKLPIVLKGIQSVADAQLAVEHGIEGIIVSNHGGHTINSLRPSLHSVADIASAVGHSIEVYMDGGVRSGEDVLKALAAGARAVLIARAYLWGLMVDSELGVTNVLETMRSELSRTMAFCGIGDVTQVPRDLLYLKT